MSRDQEQQHWVYLDNNATTRPDEQVVAAMLPYMREMYANASASYGPGALCAEAVCRARESLCTFLHAERLSEIIFTSGGRKRVMSYNLLI